MSALGLLLALLFTVAAVATVVFLREAAHSTGRDRLLVLACLTAVCSWPLVLLLALVWALAEALR